MHYLFFIEDIIQSPNDTYITFSLFFAKNQLLEFSLALFLIALFLIALFLIALFLIALFLIALFFGYAHSYHNHA